MLVEQDRQSAPKASRDARRQLLRGIVREGDRSLPRMDVALRCFDDPVPDDCDEPSALEAARAARAMTAIVHFNEVTRSWTRMTEDLIAACVRWTVNGAWKQQLSRLTKSDDPFAPLGIAATVALVSRMVVHLVVSGNGDASKVAHDLSGSDVATALVRVADQGIAGLEPVASGAQAQHPMFVAEVARALSLYAYAVDATTEATEGVEVAGVGSPAPTEASDDLPSEEPVAADGPVTDADDEPSAPVTDGQAVAAGVDADVESVLAKGAELARRCTTTVEACWRAYSCVQMLTPTL